ncbi:MAG: glycosyltransferase [Anaerolineae bacterium]|nr:glycosyltransferase [Anaerolineae bacterium]
MRVVFVSYFYDRDLTTPAALLERYFTLTGWADALVEVGAQVAVVQRFGHDAEVVRNGVVYTLARDPARRFGGLLDWPHRINQAVVAQRPDVVHVNGLAFARQARLLKRALRYVPLFLQDHADAPPKRWLHKVSLRLALRQMDGFGFAARDLARPWLDSGLLPANAPLFELMEGSSLFGLDTRSAARARTGLAGDPLCLWVGRLNSNKDPLTVLKGFARALPHLPRARLVMVYGEAELLHDVQEWLKGDADTAGHVTLLGSLPHRDLEAIYNSADFFLLGSHHEGSGYAVLEALSCGVVPIVTNIPSFRTLTGDGTMGGLWPVGDADALARTLVDWHERLQPDAPEKMRAFFDQNFSFSAIGRKALAAYAALIEGARP